MKIELISMQRVINHGSFLQAYGLKSMLNKYVEDVRFADIIPGLPNNDVNEQFVEGVQLPRMIRYKIRLLERIQKKVIIKQQQKVLNVDKHFAHDEIKDIAFIGSDEMFNCLAPSPWGISEQLFGNVPNCRKVYTYAVSCGHTTIEKVPERYFEYLQNALNRVNEISVRDENTANFVRKLINKEPQFNLDPVLMYDYSNEIKECKYKKKYLLVYSYTNRINTKSEINAIIKFARERNLTIIGAGVFQYWCDKNIVVTPFELLGFFKNAEYVITDTFHGAVISIKYNRQFIAFVRKSNEMKLYDLLVRLRLEERRVDTIENFQNIVNKVIDYKQTNQILETEKENAYRYIENCIKGN